MWRFICEEPDAVALLLLCGLVGGTLLVGLWAGRRRDRSGRDPVAHESVTTWPHLLRRELVAALGVMLVVTWWAIGLDLPLVAEADPRVTPAVAKAPWFFVGVQEMLQYFDAWLAGAVLPAVMLIGLCALPYLDVGKEASGRYTWCARPIGVVVTVLLVILWLAPMVIGLFLRGEAWLLQPPWVPAPLALPPPPPPVALADVVGVSGAAAQALGAVVVVGPLAALGLAWPRLRRRPRFARLGLTRYLVAAGLLVVCLEVILKVILRLAFDVRYFWVTPWFRI